MGFEVNKTASSGYCSMLFGAGQRAHFGAFNAKNDVNSKTKRSGVRLYTNKVAIWILSKLGKTETIKVGDKEYVVNKKSFQNWKTRHSATGKAYANLNAAALIEKVLTVLARKRAISRKTSDAEFHSVKEVPASLEEAKAMFKKTEKEPKKKELAEIADVNWRLERSEASPKKISDAEFHPAKETPASLEAAKAVFKLEAEQDAATKIQTAIRSYLAKNKVAQMKKNAADAAKNGGKK